MWIPDCRNRSDVWRPLLHHAQRCRAALPPSLDRYPRDDCARAVLDSPGRS
jgi:hypothetical protein